MPTVAEPKKKNTETISAICRFKGACYKRHGAWWISWVPLAWMMCGGQRRYRRFVLEATARRWLDKIVTELAKADRAHKWSALHPDPIDETVAEMNAKRSPDAPRATRTEAASHILRQGLDLDDGEPTPTPPKAAPARN
jgi:hypothetical protein